MTLVLTASGDARLRLLLQRVAGWPVVWAAVATAMVVVAYCASTGFGLTESLGDTDDAVRLYTVRELLAGGAYFDTTLARIGAPDALVSHWSRLIDVPLAGLMLLLAPLVGAPAAELAVRAAWPVLLFGGLALIVAREAKRQAGAAGAAIAMVLIMTCGFAIVQFRPGRIDHHNAQILCAVGAILFLVRSVREPRAGWWAGLLLGLGLAIGYEAIALVLPMLALACLGFVLAPLNGDGPVRAAVAATGTLALCLIATTRPQNLLDSHCDALSLNLVLLAAGATAGLWAISVLRLSRPARLGLAAGGGAIGLALFGGLESACLAGPFGQVNPALQAIWLDNVLETQSLFAFAAQHPEAGLPQIAFMAMGVAAQIILFARARDATTALATAGTVLAVALGLWQVKLTPYASWLVVLPLTALAGSLPGTPSLSPFLVRAFAVLLISQTTIGSLVAIASETLRGDGPSTAADGPPSANACTQTQTVQRLSQLPPGLMAADLDLGAYVAALTPHRVVAAPYHRIDKGILALETIFKGTAAERAATLRTLGVSYVATCGRDGPPMTSESATPSPARGLRGQLLSGHAPAGFEEIDIGTGALRVWRVRPDLTRAAARNPRTKT